jgi:hypothetical protein
VLAMPPSAGEHWYLFTGSAPLPAALLSLISTPEGVPATKSPDAAQLISWKGSGGVTWHDHAHNHLPFPRVYTLLPPSCKRAVIWNRETSKLDGVSPPSECSTSAPGHGFIHVPLGGDLPECLQTHPANNLLIVLEAQCVAGLIPHPTGKGPREALQPVFNNKVEPRIDDDTTPMLTRGASSHACHLVVAPDVRSEVVLRLQPFGDATVKTWTAYLSSPTSETGSGDSDDSDETNSGSGVCARRPSHLTPLDSPRLISLLSASRSNLNPSATSQPLRQRRRARRLE